MPQRNLKKLEEISEIIKSAASDAGLNPGVYKMIDECGKIIYVGKAKHLKNRLISYTRFNQLANRTKMMVSHINSVEFIIVNSEIEALLLESNLIKQFRPFYNVLLKDDKTFPYIVIDEAHEFPRIFKYRTLKPKGKTFFGPYPAVSALDETIKVIQKTFLLRNCTDTYFDRRDRPCLQFFIKRCSAPCMRKISKAEYAENVNFAKDLLNGRDELARKTLAIQMNKAAKDMNFELAAVIRDRIKAISEIQSRQYIQIDNLTAIDFIALGSNFDNFSIAVTFFRAGKNVGTETFSIGNAVETEPAEIIESFILQFYKNMSPPSAIITNFELKDADKISEYIKISTEQNVKIIFGQNGVYRKILDTAENNALIRLKRECTNKYENQLQELCDLVGISKINRIETYDNSHIQGTNACGVMVVFENGAIQKNKARKFNIDDTTSQGGDDIQMMRFSLEKRFKSKRIPEIPDLIIIDGGKTQLHVAQSVLSELGFSEQVKVIGIAKQNDRKMGDEKIVLENGDEIVLGQGSELLSFLIILRNEAHRTAITFHRKKRSKGMTKSALDQIVSVGSARKKLLLEHFGSAELVKKASIDDLKMVKGIDDRTATAIFEFFNKAKK